MGLKWGRVSTSLSSLGWCSSCWCGCHTLSAKVLKMRKKQRKGTGVLIDSIPFSASSLASLVKPHWIFALCWFPSFAVFVCVFHNFGKFDIIIGALLKWYHFTTLVYTMMGSAIPKHNTRSCKFQITLSIFCLYILSAFEMHIKSTAVSVPRPTLHRTSGKEEDSCYIWIL